MSLFINDSFDNKIDDTIKYLSISIKNNEILKKFINYINLQTLSIVNDNNDILDLGDYKFDYIKTLKIYDASNSYSKNIFSQIYNNFPNIEKLTITATDWDNVYDTEKKIFFSDKIIYLVFNCYKFYDTTVKLPTNLELLKTNVLFDNMPETLDTLVLYNGLQYTTFTTNSFPNNLKKLYVNGNYQNIIDFLPDSLECLKFKAYTQAINKLPKSLKYIKLPIFYSNNKALEHIKHVEYYDSKWSFDNVIEPEQFDIDDCDIKENEFIYRKHLNLKY